VVVLLLLVGAHASVESPVFKVRGDSLGFVSMGDWGLVNDIQSRVAHSIAASAAQINAQFLLSLGDNFYETGVKSDTDPQWETTYHRPFNATALNVPWLSILGNHDHDGNPQAQIDYYLHKRDQRWVMPHNWYSVHWEYASKATAQFVFIDTILLDPALSLAAIMHAPDDERRQSRLAAWLEPSAVARREQMAIDQWAWINETLANATSAKWLFVLGHYPVYSGGEHGSSDVLVRQLKPLMDKYKVDAYFNGHDHNLQYLVDGKVSYYLSGNAAKTNGEYHPIQQSVWGSLQNGYTIHSLNETSLTTQYLDSTGKPLYQVVQPSARM